VSQTRFPIARLLLPAAAVAAALVALVAANWLGARAADRASDRRVDLIRMVDRIRLLDETLTGSARIAVATGDDAESARYTRLATAYDELLRQTDRAADDRAVSSAVRATGPPATQLFGLEERALRLAAAGRLRDGARLIESPVYVAQKRIYADRLGRVLAAVERVSRREERVADRARPLTLIVGVLGLATILLALRGVLRTLRRWGADRARAEERLGSILDSAGEGIYGLDADGRVEFVNPAAAALTGHSRDELIGEHSHDVVHHHHADGRVYPLEECPVFEAIRDGEPRRVSGEHYWRKDGTSFPVDYTATPIVEDGVSTGAVVVFSDVSERRQIERMKDQFTSTVSHELRTPLTSIRGSLGLLASGALGALPDKGQRMVDIAVQNTDRLVRLINDILDIERIDAGEVAMDLRTCDAADLVEQAAQVMEGMATKAGLRLESSAEPVAVLADPDRIVQTLTNLLSNAIKFSPAGSTVELRARRQDDQALFEVRDQGRGIPEDKLETVFERFGQVDATDAREKGGTGLGLPICRSIVEQHGGRIWAESVLGEGSTFSFAVPAAKPAEDDAPGPGPDAPLVLVCDDDASIRAILDETLRLNGYRTALAASGEEAVALAREARPDVVLLDLLMPGMDGWATARELQEVPSFAGVPILVVSVVDRDAAARQGPDAQDWLTKPFDEPALLRALERATGAGTRPPQVLLIEDDDDLANVLVAGIESSGARAARAATGGQAIALARRVDPDVLVLDLGLPDAEGVDIVDLIRGEDRFRSVPIVVYTARDLVGTELERLRRRDVSDVLVKGRVTPEQLEQRVTELLGTVIRSRTAEP